MKLKVGSTMILAILLGVIVPLSAAARQETSQLATRTGDQSFKCSPTGAPPIRTVPPITERPSCHPRGQVVSFDQNGVTRYACLYPPQQAAETQIGKNGYKWPLLIYLHASLTTPESLHWLGRDLLDLADAFPLSGDEKVKGFFVLAPESRIADPWPSNAPGAAETGSGTYWDEWYRDPSRNLDALAVDHFVDQLIASEKVDTSRIYVFGWSNGAYMAALYGMWRSDRIAAIGQYAGADPYSRPPCPVPMEYHRQVPLILLRNLCDGRVSCETTGAWIDTLTKEQWPYKLVNLDLSGEVTSSDQECYRRCSKIIGLFEHIRWPRDAALKEMLRFFNQHVQP